VFALVRYVGKKIKGLMAVKLLTRRHILVATGEPPPSLLVLCCPNFTAHLVHAAPVYKALARTESSSWLAIYVSSTDLSPLAQHNYVCTLVGADKLEGWRARILAVLKPLLRKKIQMTYYDDILRCRKQARSF